MGQSPRDWRNHCTWAVVASQGGPLLPAERMVWNPGNLTDALKLNHLHTMKWRDAQHGKKGEMRGRASVQVVPQGASLSQSVVPRVRFMHCRFFCTTENSTICEQR